MNTSDEYAQGMDAAQFEVHARHETEHWWFVARRKIVRDVLATICPPAPDKRLLDFGCGTGANAAWFAECYSTIGVDVSRHAIALARARFPTVEFRCGELSALRPQWPPNIQLVTLLDVLEHVQDDLHLFAQLLDLLEPGTRLLLTVPANVELWSPHDVALGHYRRYAQQRLRQVWEGQPVRCDLLTHFNSRLYPPIRLVRWLTRSKGKGVGQAGTDLTLPPHPVNLFLTRLFHGEAKRIVRALTNGQDSAYPRGVSLMAVLTRLSGDVDLRTRRTQVAPDIYDPLEQRYL